MAKTITKQTVTVAKAQAGAMIVTVEEARKAAQAIEALVATWDPTRYYYSAHVKLLTTIAGVSGIIWLADFETEGTKAGVHLPALPFAIDDAGKASTCFGTVFLNDELHPKQEGGEA